MKWQGWREEAACHFEDPRLFTHPGRIEPASEREARQDAAKQICRRCPVRWPCLLDALERPEPQSGVRGGYTEQERRNI